MIRLGSETVEGSGSRTADLVLEGGGVKGIGLVGAVVELAAQGWRFPRVAGTSAGAIVGSLVAAYQAAGCDLGDLAARMETLDYTRFRDRGLLARLGWPGKTAELLIHNGIYRGEYLLRWLAAELDAVGVRTFGDLRITDDPDADLLPHQCYRLVVVASDISRGQLVRLPWDYHYYGLDPDRQRIVDAVHASAAIPLFFRPITLRCGPDGGGDVTLVDGALLSNFPVEIFDRTDGRPARWPTFGVKLSARPRSRQVSHPIDGPVDLAMASLRTLLAAHDAYHLDDERITARTIFVDTMRVSPVDFDVDPATERLLYEKGRSAARRFLADRDT